MRPAPDPPKTRLTDTLQMAAAVDRWRNQVRQLTDERDFWLGEAMALRARFALEEAIRAKDEAAIKVASLNLTRAEAMRITLPRLDRALEDYLLPRSGAGAS